ncbi:DUF4870 domain-containing protein [Patescibacteria group bacterium]|nr:DUF4870 domain-containing protein [Patescibacteria group bacterium]MBU0963578.1 DUF4870 domain-containing protein [Patescibacteria group bacterium]
MEEKNPVSKNSDSNLMGALAYVWILSVVMLVIKKDDEFVKFHAKQGLILFIVSWIGIVPVIGWIIDVVVVLFIIIGFIKALSGEKYKIPLVGDLASKINI